MAILPGNSPSFFGALILGLIQFLTKLSHQRNEPPARAICFAIPLIPAFLGAETVFQLCQKGFCALIEILSSISVFPLTGQLIP